MKTITISEKEAQALKQAKNILSELVKKNKSDPEINVLYAHRHVQNVVKKVGQMR